MKIVIHLRTSWSFTGINLSRTRTFIEAFSSNTSKQIKRMRYRNRVRLSQKWLAAGTRFMEKSREVISFTSTTRFSFPRCSNLQWDFQLRHKTICCYRHCHKLVHWSHRAKFILATMFMFSLSASRAFCRHLHVLSLTPLNKVHLRWAIKILEF